MVARDDVFSSSKSQRWVMGITTYKRIQDAGIQKNDQFFLRKKNHFFSPAFLQSFGRGFLEFLEELKKSPLVVQCI